MKREFIASLLLAASTALTAVPALAQTVAQQQQIDPNADINDPAAMGPGNQYGDPVCGVWVNGVWQPNGRCPGYAVGPHRARVEGTITAVRGHLVTLQQTNSAIVIDDQPALNREMSGRVAVGREIIAFGYWRDGNFFATAME
jgi:hypothetical protein